MRKAGKQEPVSDVFPAFLLSSFKIFTGGSGADH
jgi:hypothetical protein